MTEPNKRSWAPRPMSVWSLRGTLMLVLAALVVAVSASLFVWLPATLEERAVEALQDKATSIAEVTAFSVRSAMEFGVVADIREDLERISGQQDISYLRVVGRDGLVITGGGGRPGIGGDNGSLLEVTTPILGIAADTLGLLELGVSTHQVREEVGRVRRAVGLMSLLILVVGMIGVVVTSHFLTRPLSAIVDVAEGIASGRLSERAPGFAFDEVDRLAESFNRMVDQLQAGRERLAEILDRFPALVSVFDQDLRCTYYNTAVAPGGAPSGPRDPERFWEVLSTPPGLTERMRATLQAALDRGTQQYMEATLPGSLQRTILFFASPFGTGSTTGVIGYGADITERKAAEEALAQSRDQLRQAQKMEAVGRLAGGIAHDFNNLLTVISGYVELLQGESQGATRSMLDEVAAAADHASALTRQLLAFSRKHVVKPERLALDDVLQGATRLLARIIGEDVRMETGWNAPDTFVEIDRGQLEQVVINLAVNARDAMPRGGVLRITSWEQRTDEGRWAFFQVRDTGHGMDAETASRVFEPFFTTKDVGRGTGLGLATVYGVVTEAQGTVDVVSAPGEGTTFTIRLPARGEGEQRDGEEDLGDIRGTETILVVEDEPAVCHMISRMLGDLGYAVHTAQNSTEALEFLDGREVVPDLLLTDVIMPGRSGRQLSVLVRERIPDIAVLFMSGYTDDHVLVRGVSSSNIAFIQKPFTAATLGRAIRSTLKGKTAPDL